MIALLASIMPLLSIIGIDCTNPGLWGTYHTETKQIAICNWHEQEQTDFHILHEVGHYYWFEKMSQGQRERFKNMYSKTKPENFYRTYSWKMVEEDFADMFAVVAMNKLRWKLPVDLRNKQIQAKYRYIENITEKSR